jgi:inner membrane protein YidH
VPSDGDAAREPDYRFTLANERTFLAWIRTALALLAGGVALHSLGGFSSSAVRTGLAIAAVALSLVLTVGAYARWRRVQDAMRAGTPLPRPYAVPLLATGVAVVAAAVALVLVAG